LNRSRVLAVLAALAPVLAAPLPARADDARMTIRRDDGSPPITIEKVDAQGVLSGGAAGSVVGNVRSVDRAKRQVVLHAGDRVETMDVGPEVKNLERLDVGDRVSIRYRVGLVLHPLAAGEAAEASEASRQGKKTGAGDVLSGNEVLRGRTTATVESVDAPARTATMRTAEGAVLHLKLGPDVAADRLKVGDRFRATYSAAMAATVDPVYRD
jgi:hypothetical protein